MSTGEHLWPPAQNGALAFLLTDSEGLDLIQRITELDLKELHPAFRRHWVLLCTQPVSKGCGRQGHHTLVLLGLDQVPAGPSLVLWKGQGPRRGKLPVTGSPWVSVFSCVK